MIAHRQLARLFYAPYPNIVWNGAPDNQTIYLTFDDGPYPPVTYPLLHMLRRYGVPATFFLSGEAMEEHHKYMPRLDYRGHQIGNHLYHHVPLFGLTKKRLVTEINRTDQLIYEHLNTLSTIFRPPYGVFSPQLFPALQSTSKKMVLWSLMANDFKWDKYKVLDHLYQSVQPGDIIVFHDSPKTAGNLLEIMPQFIRFCRAKKWSFGVIR